MATAPRNHWQPVFAPKQADTENISNYINTHMPKCDILDIGTPAKPQIKAFLRRGSPSAPGPDCLPYAAWLAHDASLDILEDLSFFLCSGQYYIRALNDSNFAFLPKGDNSVGVLTRSRA